jgi:serralysin
VSTQVIQGTTSPIVHVEAVQWGGWRWFDPDLADGAPVQINYFLDVVDRSPWTESESRWLATAFQQWSNVANVAFAQVLSANDAQFIEYKGGGDILPGFLGIHGTPELFDVYEYEENLLLGGGGKINGYFNADYWINGGLGRGSYNFATLLHELGHGLGLAHPHDNGGGSGLFPGVTDPSDLGANNLNQGIYTVMSYNDGWQTAPSPLRGDITEYGYQAGPMAFDIAAIQALYGANTDHNNGDTVYQLPTANQPGTFWSCIWDGGGNDEIKYGGGRNVLIDLKAATLDDSRTGGGMPSSAKGIYGGYTIANGVVIENATAGSGNDILRGNDSANVLKGRAGNDVLAGGRGRDTLDGGAGADTLAGGAGSDTLSYASATSGVTVKLWKTTAQDTKGAGKDTLTSIENLSGSRFDDRLTGSNGNNIIQGGAGNDWLYGHRGQDWLTGDAGADRFVFNTLDYATDIITDFEIGVDKVAISNTVFKGLGADGVLSAALFVVGSAALDANDRVVYDSATGYVSYDNNGTGVGGIHILALVGAGLALTAADVLIV